MLLATALPRSRWLLGHVAVTVVGTVAGRGRPPASGSALGYALVTGDGDAAWDVTLGRVLPYVAPVLVLGAVARLLYGAGAALAGARPGSPLVFASVVMLFGELLRLPEWVQDLSPFEHLALVPAEDFRWAPVLALCAVAARAECRGPDRVPRRRDVH